MKHQPYFPSDIPGQRAWLVKYKLNIGINGAALGLLPAQITAEQTACQDMIDEIDAADLLLTAASAKVIERDATIKTNMKPLRAGVQVKKKSPGYSDTIGGLLGIVGSEIIVDTQTVRTIVKLAAVPLGIEIKFGLEHCEGGNVYSKRGTETTFTYIKHLTHPHGVDTRPNLSVGTPETRTYIVMLEINDLEVGVASAPESITI